MTGPGQADLSLKYLILGIIKGLMEQPNFPILIQEVRVNSIGDRPESLTLVTQSGQKFRVCVEYEGQEGGDGSG